MYLGNQEADLVIARNKFWNKLLGRGQNLGETTVAGQLLTASQIKIHNGGFECRQIQPSTTENTWFENNLLSDL